MTNRERSSKAADGRGDEMNIEMSSDVVLDLEEEEKLKKVSLGYTVRVHEVLLLPKVRTHNQSMQGQTERRRLQV